MLPRFVKIVEVGPRDGLQNEKDFVPTEIKLELIRRLVDAGLTNIEATSFVSPKWVPQMADHQDLVKALQQIPDIHFPVLVPNLQGLRAALDCGVREIAIFAAASESFSKRNINCTISESLQRYHEVVAEAQKHHLKIRGYVSCAVDCPYEGEINPEQVAKVAYTLFEMGCYEISLGDTIGTATPLRSLKMIDAVAKQIPHEYLAVHFHDTYGQAIANIYAALEHGIQVIDSSVSGLGGCPYATGAGGNVATEDVLYLLNGLGIETGVDLMKLCKAGYFISDFLNKPTRSKVALALKNK
jgi:hydroxymethylglutaryl-CoA lyase